MITNEQPSHNPELEKHARERFAHIAKVLNTSGSVAGREAAWEKAATSDPEGKKYWAIWHEQRWLHQQKFLPENLANMNAPIQSPRTNAIVDMTFPGDQAEYERRWREKGFVGPGQPNTPTSTGSRGPAAFPATPKIGGDAQKKAAAQANFLSEVHRIFDRGGITYSDSWQQAALTEPGKTYMQEWLRGSDEDIASSGPISSGSRGAISGDAQEAGRKFQGEVDRLMAGGHNYQEAWGIAGTTPPGRDYYATWARG